MRRLKGSYIHPKAIVDTREIGNGTRIWAFTHLMQGVRVGKNCNIGEHCFIEKGVEVGDDVVVKNGVCLWEGVKVESRVFIGPSVVLTNVRIPRAKVFPEQYAPTIIREGASVGANATLVAPLEIGRDALIGAGSTVTKDVPAFAVVYGVPARIRGYVCRCGTALKFRHGRTRCACGLAYAKKGEKVSLL